MILHRRLDMPSPSNGGAADEEKTLRIANIAFLMLSVLLLVMVQGCYSGYAIKREDLAKLQSGTKERAVKLEAEDGEELVIVEGTGIEVTDQDGLSYRLQPFGFKVTSTQIVAPEQDLVLPLGFVDRVEVQKLNTWGTVGLFGLSVAAAAGMVVGIVATAGEDTGFE